MPHPAEQGVTHVIFDMDGLLLDTEPLYTAATEAVAARHGSTDPLGAPRPFTWDLKVRQMGLPSTELAKLIVKELALPISPEQYTEEARKLQEETFPNCTLLPGVDRLVRDLAIRNIPMAVATSSPRETFDMKTKHHKELFGFFHHVVCGSSDPEVRAGKPAPDIFQVCASRFDPPLPHPASCLVFEDSPAGVRAALAANMRCLMVPDKRMFDTPEHIPAGVTLVIQSLDELTPGELMKACDAYW